MKFVFLFSVGFLSLAARAGVIIKHDQFRQKILHTFRLVDDRKIIFKRFKGESLNACEVQIKSTPHMTTLDIIFPTTSPAQSSVSFSFHREINEHVGTSKMKYSSHFVSCSGDQYDTYRECWEYDHYDMTLMNSVKDVTVSFKGHSCRIIDFNESFD